MPVFAIQNPVFQPAMRIVTAITNAFPAAVTTSFDHNYVTGTIIRLTIPPGYGMVQANQKFGAIEVTSPTTFNIDIDTIFFDVFVVPVTFPDDRQQAQSVPFAEINSILTAATQNVLPY